MYGVPPNLPLQAFVGQEINQVCLGQFQTQLHSSGIGSISIEGHWELRDEAGVIVDAEKPHAERERYRIHQIIDVPITAFSIDAPRSFTLRFENGLELTVFDSLQRYESFSVQVSGRLVIV
ncbi:MAG: hypothetical protein WBC51_05725 [Vicinamibacterales bacterium]